MCTNNGGLDDPRMNLGLEIFVRGC
ncbi:hypothetical protein NC651_011228 [Populus alba x Populus x berolinensis]|nr:hypothetical protein NC651_011228 [Populus alba x Populus x berolinensis]